MLNFDLFRVWLFGFPFISLSPLSPFPSIISIDLLFFTCCDEREDGTEFGGRL